MKCDVDLYIAHVDDEYNMLYAINRGLKRRGIMTEMLLTPKDLKDASNDISLILSDGTNIIDDTIKYRDLFLPDIPILLYSGDRSLVSDYKRTHNLPGIVKPVSVDCLSSMIREYARRLTE